MNKKAVKAYNPELGLTFYFRTGKDAGTYLGCDPSVIAKITKGKLESSWGWTFEKVMGEFDYVTEEMLKNPLVYEKKKTPWNKGKTDIYSEESLQRMSEVKRGKSYSEERRSMTMENKITEKEFLNGIQSISNSCKWILETLKKPDQIFVSDCIAMMVIVLETLESKDMKGFSIDKIIKIANIYREVMRSKEN